MKPLSAILAIAAVAVTTLPALAQSVSDAWKLKCDDASCTSSLAMKNPDTGRLAATFTATLLKDEDAPFVGVALPLGAALKAGVRLVVDDHEIELPFDVCYPDGCRAVRALNPNEVASLRDGETLDIRFFPFGSEKPVSMSMPLDGFSDALDEAEEKLAN